MIRPRSERTSDEEQDISTVTVKLKPIVGIRPPVYLTVIYALLVGFVLFLLFFYPGIRRRGTWTTFVSSPPGAAVYVDDGYVGATPVETLVPPGSHVIEISRPRLDAQTFTAEFGGRIFGTLFVRPKDSYRVELQLSDVKGYASYHVEDFARYSHVAAMGLLWGAVDVLAAPVNRRVEIVEGLYDLVFRSMYFSLGQGAHVADVIRAVAYISAGGGVFGAGSVVRTVQFFIQRHARHDYLPYWFVMNLPREASQRVSGAPAFQSFHTRVVASIMALPAVAAPALSPAVSLASLQMRYISGGLAIIGNDTDLAGLSDRVETEMPRPVTVHSFYMAETEVTNAQFAEFIAANPRWQPSNQRVLEAENLVGDSYLESWVDDAPPPESGDFPVTNVSHAAARAYCVWFSSALPARFSGYAVRLPFQAEWEWAARGGSRHLPYGAGATSAGVFRTEDTEGPSVVASGQPNGYGLYDMSGNVWEWCQDWYAPAAPFLASSVPSRNLVDTSGETPMGVEKVVRGGSWANYSQQVRVYTRGSQPPEWTTPFLGFRVVLLRTVP